MSTCTRGLPSVSYRSPRCPQENSQLSASFEDRERKPTVARVTSTPVLVGNFRLDFSTNPEPRWFLIYSRGRYPFSLTTYIHLRSCFRVEGINRSGEILIKIVFSRKYRNGVSTRDRMPRHRRKLEGEIAMHISGPVSTAACNKNCKESRRNPTLLNFKYIHQ